MQDIIQIHPKDNVVVALRDFSISEKFRINGESVKTSTPVKMGHKIALKNIATGENIIKYGASIGHATQDIKRGEHIHTHNIRTNLSGLDNYEYQPEFSSIDIPVSDKTFMGYIRKNGDVGIRNELWIIPTVGCVNGVANSIAKIFQQKNGIEDDKIHVFTHNYGCSQLGDDHVNTRSALASMVTHPNTGGVLVLGLGCENNQIDTFKECLDEYDSDRVMFINSQDEDDEVSKGVEALENLYNNIKNDTRKKCNLSDLKIGLKCGGSDGFSGITANPLLGDFSDFLVANGGSTILTEVPEMFGAEHLLMKRASNNYIFEKTVSLINNFKCYFKSHNQPVYENPSPGNKKGGISTLEEKSLGCTQKAGHSNVVDVLKYGEKIKTNGLNLLNAPGNDLVASSALGFSGCQMVLFTTGRGTPFGSFIPTIKVSTNTKLSENKSHWIDFDAGKLLDKSYKHDVLEEFISYILEIASGTKVAHEIMGSKEIAIFKTGVTL